jgi:hypothetical protein
LLYIWSWCLLDIILNKFIIKPSTSSLAKAADDSLKAKGGLKVEAHPALSLDQSGKLDLKRVAALIPKPNFATVKVSYIKN